MMNWSIRTLALGALALALVGCGGGGGSPGMPAITSVPLHTALVNLDTTGYQKSLTISGTATNGTQTLPITGNMLLTATGYATAATFEGAPALSNTSTMSGTVTILTTSAPFASSLQGYITSNYVPLGMQSTDEYCVVTSAPAIPATGTVGTMGTYFVADCYADSSKAVLLGTETVSYAVSPGTGPSTLTLTETDSAVGVGNVQAGTQITTFQINASGAITFGKIEIIGTLSGVTVDMTGS